MLGWVFSLAIISQSPEPVLRPELKQMETQFRELGVEFANELSSPQPNQERLKFLILRYRSLRLERDLKVTAILNETLLPNSGSWFDSLRWYLTTNSVLKKKSDLPPLEQIKQQSILFEVRHVRPFRSFLKGLTHGLVAVGVEVAAIAGIGILMLDQGNYEWATALDRLFFTILHSSNGLINVGAFVLAAWGIEVARSSIRSVKAEDIAREKYFQLLSLARAEDLFWRDPRCSANLSKISGMKEDLPVDWLSRLVSH